MSRRKVRRLEHGLTPEQIEVFRAMSESLAAAHQRWNQSLVTMGEAVARMAENIRLAEIASGPDTQARTTHGMLLSELLDQSTLDYIAKRDAKKP